MKLNPNYILNEVGGEFMLVYTGRDIARLNTVFSMNEATAYIWKRIGSQDVEEADLVAWLLEEYEVDERTAKADVHRIVGLWLKAGLAEIADK